jgi:hypothetical protein
MMRLWLAIAISAAMSLAGQQPLEQLPQPTLTAELKADPNPGRRVEKCLGLADQAFDSADEFYNKGDIHKGDAELDEMTSDLKVCLDALDTAHKPALWKKAELRVALLQRKLRGLLDNIGVEQRGWAEYTDRKLDEIHDKMLEGVMRR